MTNSDKFLAHLFQAFNCQYKHINSEELTKLMFLKAETRDYCRLDFQNWDGWTRKRNGEDWRSDCYLPERLLCQPAFSPLEEMVSTQDDYQLPAGIWGN